jgi:hypothetical protein
MKTCLVGVATLIAVAACSGAAKVRTSGDTSAPSSPALTTAVAQSRAPCTAEDLARVTVLRAPKGRVVTETMDLGAGWFLDPPPAGVTPKLRPDEALPAMHQAPTPSAAGVELWLGVYRVGPSQPLGAPSPVLAWVQVVHHVAVTSAFPHPPPAPGMTEPPLPVCFWAEETSAVNANTGEQIGGISIASTDPAVFGTGTATGVDQTIAWLDQPTAAINVLDA